MSDDKGKRGPADRSRINMHEPYEVEYWTGHFGVSRDKLQRAVNAVGVMVKDVEAWLSRN